MIQGACWRLWAKGNLNGLRQSGKLFCGQMNFKLYFGKYGLCIHLTKEKRNQLIIGIQFKSLHL